MNQPHPTENPMADSCDLRVLVVSHRAFNDKGGTGNTLAAFFKQWDPNALAELYFHAELPCGPMRSKCSRYYRITDFDVLRSVLGQYSCGSAVDSEPRGEASRERGTSPSVLQQRIYEFGRKQHPSTMLLRDAIWGTARWRTCELSRWLEEFSPEVVFLVGGEYTFAYRVACYVAESRAVPLAVFLGDDVCCVSRFSLSPLFWLHKALIRRAMRHALGSAARLFSACDLMGEEYRRMFGVDSTTLPTSCGRIEPVPAWVARTPIELSYLGKVSLGRWSTLRRIGEALHDINALGQRAVLRIYSTERLEHRMVECLSIPGALEFMGGLDAVEVSQVLVKSDILVHVESMDKENRKLTRLSLSTKIPEYLASGRCILAAGPAEVASIRYIREHDAGMVVTEMEALRGGLETLISSPELRKNYALNSVRLARQRHDSKIVTNLLETTLRNAISNKTRASIAMASAGR
jgi:glycosyltransferase involved in cell wall biosynthesis